MDMLGRLALPPSAQRRDKQVPWAGTEFPYDYSISGEPEGDPRPLELTVKVLGLVFRDGTAAGDTSFVTWVRESRKKMALQFTTELTVVNQVARLEDAKAILKGDPDPSLEGAVRAFWLENKSNVGNDPAKWAAFITSRVSNLQLLVELMSEYTELKMGEQ